MPISCSDVLKVVHKVALVLSVFSFSRVLLSPTLICDDI
jgi:hypothetical protein